MYKTPSAVLQQTSTVDNSSVAVGGKKKVTPEDTDVPDYQRNSTPYTPLTMVDTAIDDVRNIDASFLTMVDMPFAINDTPHLSVANNTPSTAANSMETPSAVAHNMDTHTLSAAGNTNILQGTI